MILNIINNYADSYRPPVVAADPTAQVARVQAVAQPALRAPLKYSLIAGSFWDWVKFKFTSDKEKRLLFNTWMKAAAKSEKPFQTKAWEQIRLMIDRGFNPNVVYLQVRESLYPFTAPSVSFDRKSYAFYQAISKKINESPHYTSEQKEKLFHFFSMPAHISQTSLEHNKYQETECQETLSNRQGIILDMLSHADTNETYRKDLLRRIEKCQCSDADLTDLGNLWGTSGGDYHTNYPYYSTLSEFACVFNDLFIKWKMSAGTDQEREKYTELKDALAPVGRVSYDAYKEFREIKDKQQNGQVGAYDHHMEGVDPTILWHRFHSTVAGIYCKHLEIPPLPVGYIGNRIGIAPWVLNKRINPLLRHTNYRLREVMDPYELQGNPWGPPPYDLNEK